MRLSLVFDSDYQIFLPKNYNSIVQGFIYSHMGKDLGDAIHEEGFNRGKRQYRLFTFSRVGAETIKPNSEGFFFLPPITLHISSVLPQVIQALSESIQAAQHLSLGPNLRLQLKELKIETKRDFKDQQLIRMLSPMTVYSTLYSPEGQQKRYYYNPLEKEFSFKIEENAIRKYESYLQRDYAGPGIRIRPHRVTPKMNHHVIRYKGGVINAWDGLYHLQGDPALISFLYHAGLGSKNAQGFGCFEVVKEI